MAKGGKRQGAGRPGWRVRLEDCPRLDIRQLGHACQSGNVAALPPSPATLPVIKTACAFGGYRQWFVCPKCQRRAVTLFVCREQLACRVCLGLAYRSQSSNAMQTAMVRMFKHMNRLAPDFTRPKGMHWQTYCRLLSNANKATMPAWQMVQQHNQDIERQLQALVTQHSMRN